ncbi:hypothetical protein BDZ94DRAFT_1327762 [Collybia nuda]|uniref:CBM21 domain-containing protein n=1 Tax=Collybia nuda TaxID=64659 RepID=A0A9P5YIW8_9AGAR|nr:hypothetical protein BDZ94DRAFT_1327762 [Collybia nuda]
MADRVGIGYGHSARQARVQPALAPISNDGWGEGGSREGGTSSFVGLWFLVLAPSAGTPVLCDEIGTSNLDRRRDADLEWRSINEKKSTKSGPQISSWAFELLGRGSCSALFRRMHDVRSVFPRLLEEQEITQMLIYRVPLDRDHTTSGGDQFRIGPLTIDRECGFGGLKSNQPQTPNSKLKISWCPTPHAHSMKPDQPTPPSPTLPQLAPSPNPRLQGRMRRPHPSFRFCRMQNGRRDARTTHHQHHLHRLSDRPAIPNFHRGRSVGVVVSMTMSCLVTNSKPVYYWKRGFGLRSRERETRHAWARVGVGGFRGSGFGIWVLSSGSGRVFGLVWGRAGGGKLFVLVVKVWGDVGFEKISDRAWKIIMPVGCNARGASYGRRGICGAGGVTIAITLKRNVRSDCGEREKAQLIAYHIDMEGACVNLITRRRGVTHNADNDAYRYRYRASCRVIFFNYRYANSKGRASPGWSGGVLVDGCWEIGSGQTASHVSIWDLRILIAECRKGKKERADLRVGTCLIAFDVTNCLFLPQGRPGHRRSYTDTRGPGAFAPLGLLPRRRAAPKSAGATFHFRNDDPDHDDHDSSLSDDDNDSDDRRISNIPPLLRLKSPAPGTHAYRGLSINTTPGPVPFPRSRPLPSPLSAPGPPSARPGVTRTTSTPIFLSNGKPLKSSLKSSSSSPSIASPTQDHSPHQLPLPQPPTHLRARSAPTSPTGEGEVNEPEITPLLSPTPSHKNVHFPSKEQGGLETVHVFSRSARPASLSLSFPLAEDTETDTETDRDSNMWPGRNTSTTPFPRVRSSLAPSQTRKVYAIHEGKTSSVPAPALDPGANIYLETLVLQSSSSASSSSSVPGLSSPPTLALTGTLLVRNLAYEKTVAVRFTLDDWHTTSEVAAHYRASLPALPPRIHRAGSGVRSTTTDTSPPTSDDSDEAEAGTSVPNSTPQWDRFAFTIRLEDYHPTLSTRTLWLVARYVAGSIGAIPAPAPGIPLEGGAGGGGMGKGRVGEWWDNNAGGNYRVVFCEREKEKGEVMRRRKVAVSAPLPTASFALPTTTPAHAHAMATSSNGMPTMTPQGLLAHSPSHTTQLAQTTLQRLRKLNLKNYAAPVMREPSVSPGSEIAPAVPQQQPTPTPTSTSSSDDDDDEEEEDGPVTPAPAPHPSLHPKSNPGPISGAGLGFGFGAFGFGEMVGGFPATYPALPGFEYEYDTVGAGLGLGANAGAGVSGMRQVGKGYEVGMAAFEASTSPPGMSAFGASTEPTPAVGGSGHGKGVALYWPWGSSYPKPDPESSLVSASSAEDSSLESEAAKRDSASASEKKKEKGDEEGASGSTTVPSVKISAPAPAPTSSPFPSPLPSPPPSAPGPPRVHTHTHAHSHALPQLLRHAHAPRTSSPLASPRMSPAPSPTTSPRVSPVASPLASPAPSPAGSPRGSPMGSPTPSRSSSLESVSDAAGSSSGSGSGTNGRRKARRVFPPEEPVVLRRLLPVGASGMNGGAPARPLIGGRAYTTAAAPAPAPGPSYSSSPVPAPAASQGLSSGPPLSTSPPINGPGPPVREKNGTPAPVPAHGQGNGEPLKDVRDPDSDSVYQAFFEFEFAFEFGFALGFGFAFEVAFAYGDRWEGEALILCGEGKGRKEEGGE